MKKREKKIQIVILALGVLVLFGLVAVFGINVYVKSLAEDSFIYWEEATKLKGVDAILVLGCQVKADGSPCPMLKDRLEKGIELYQSGACLNMLMSGDHRSANYDEVGAMKRYAEGEGVPSEDILTDPAGLSTYESIQRAKEVFGARKIIIVTQKYHLYRALYIAKKLGLEAYGVSADSYRYGGQFYRDLRETLARVKDFAMCLKRP